MDGNLVKLQLGYKVTKLEDNKYVAVNAFHVRLYNPVSGISPMFTHIERPFMIPLLVGCGVDKTYYYMDSSFKVIGTSTKFSQADALNFLREHTTEVLTDWNFCDSVNSQMSLMTYKQNQKVLVQEANRLPLLYDGELKLGVPQGQGTHEHLLADGTYGITSYYSNGVVTTELINDKRQHTLPERYRESFESQLPKAGQRVVACKGMTKAFIHGRSVVLLNLWTGETTEIELPEHMTATITPRSPLYHTGVPESLYKKRYIMGIMMYTPDSRCCTETSVIQVNLVSMSMSIKNLLIFNNKIYNPNNGQQIPFWDDALNA